jgi:hypothetical protein
LRDGFHQAVTEAPSKRVKAAGHRFDVSDFLDHPETRPPRVGASPGRPIGE